MKRDHHLLFCSHISLLTRVLLLIFSIVPLIVPYQLLIRPTWNEYGVAFGFFLVISAGATLLSVLVLYCSIFGVNQIFDFDFKNRKLNYSYNSAFLKRRNIEFSFSEIKSLSIAKHQWSDGPDTYNIQVLMSAHKTYEFGNFTDQRNAEEYRSQLANVLGL